jgi:hypothetical protein
VTPCFQRPASIVSIIQIGRDGSSIAIPMLANVMAPATHQDTCWLSNTLYTDSQRF